MNLLTRLFKLWKTLPKYKTYADMPIWLVLPIGLGSAIVAWYYGNGLAVALPMYLKASTKTQELGAIGIWLGIILIMLFVVTYIFGLQAKACHDVIKEQYFE